MASNMKKPKSITFTFEDEDGDSYTKEFVMDNYAYELLDELEEGKSVGEWLKELFEGRIKAINAYLWAGLYHDFDEDTTIKDVAHLFSPSNIMEISNMMIQQMVETTPDPEDDSKN